MTGLGFGADSMLIRLVSMIAFGMALAWPAIAGEPCSKAFRLGWTDLPAAVEEDGEALGLDIEITRSIFARAGCTFTVVGMPFRRYLAALEVGEVDVIMSASWRPERDAFALFSAPYRRERMILFGRPERADWQALANLEELARSEVNVAVPLGMWLGSAFTKFREMDQVFRARTITVDGYPLMVKAVLSGRVDALIGDSLDVRFLINELGREGQIVPWSLVIHENNLHFMFSRRTVVEQDVAQINRAIGDFVGSRRYQEIVTRYTSLDAAAALPIQE